MSLRFLSSSVRPGVLTSNGPFGIHLYEKRHRLPCSLHDQVKSLTSNSYYTAFCHRHSNPSIPEPISNIPPQAIFHVSGNTLYSSRADRVNGGCPCACPLFLQGFSAGGATGCFPVLLFCAPFSTLRPVRRARFYCSQADIFLGMKLVSAPFTGASTTSSSC